MPWAQQSKKKQKKGMVLPSVFMPKKILPE
jgi:hypothetical protein